MISRRRTRLRTLARTPVRSRTTAVLGTLATGTLLTGCLGFGGDRDAGTNGVAELPPAAIERQAKSAAVAAPTVRLSGTVAANGRSYRLDMRLRSDGAVGEVTADGNTFQLLRVGSALYLKANAGFYGATGDSKDSRTAAAELNGKYVKVPPTDPAYAQFLGFTDGKALLADLFVLDGPLTLGGRRTVGGTKTIVLNGTHGSSLDISLKGTPYPLRYQRPGNSGILTLSDWGQDFTLTAPGTSDVVDYGKSLGATPSPTVSRS